MKRIILYIVISVSCIAIGILTFVNSVFFNECRIGRASVYCESGSFFSIFASFVAFILFVIGVLSLIFYIKGLQKYKRDKKSQLGQKNKNKGLKQ